MLPASAHWLVSTTYLRQQSRCANIVVEQIDIHVYIDVTGSQWTKPRHHSHLLPERELHPILICVDGALLPSRCATMPPWPSRHHCGRCQSIKRANTHIGHCPLHLWVCANNHRLWVVGKNERCELCDDKYDREDDNCVICTGQVGIHDSP